MEIFYYRTKTNRFLVGFLFTVLTGTIVVIMSVFHITTEQFEGPIDVLLHMIEKRKLPINDISLSSITDEYIRFVQGLDDELIANKTHFIFIASTLTLIKSKSLLPTLELTNEEEGDIEELKRRIAVLKIYQDLSKLIKSSFSKNFQFYYPKTPKQKISFQPHPKISQNSIHQSIFSVFKEIPEKPENKKEGYVKIAVHIEEMMQSLEDRLQTALNTDFHSYISSHTSHTKEEKEVRVYKVVGFLAMLELVKNGALQVIQKNNFSNIHIENI